MTDTLIGIDEAGTGAWAGPFAVAAVLSPERPPVWWAQMRDSKSLSPGKRERLFELIRSDLFITYAVELTPAADLDRLGSIEAERRAVVRVLEQLERSDLRAQSAAVVVDGVHRFGVGRAVIRAEDKFREVGAASIVAKVTRDRFMRELALTYPGYGFAEHKGYGTPLHLRALEELGLTPIHRVSFDPMRRMLRGSR